MVHSSLSAYCYNTCTVLISLLLPPLFCVPASNTCWDCVYSKDKVICKYSTQFAAAWWSNCNCSIIDILQGMWLCMSNCNPSFRIATANEPYSQTYLSNDNHYFLCKSNPEILQIHHSDTSWPSFKPWCAQSSHEAIYSTKLNPWKFNPLNIMKWHHNFNNIKFDTIKISMYTVATVYMGDNFHVLNGKWLFMVNVLL